ncbi:MAG: DUF4215 domain-containing protein [Kofleriaceae bacterium]
MRSRGQAARAIVIAMSLAACLPAAELERCPDGVVCPSGQACAPTGGGCVDEDQLAACAGLAAGATCALPGVGAGTCRDGVCVVTSCGDGTVDPGEACDDGNDVDDDGCTNGCALPTCGDGVRQGEEACDDGAANGDDRACTSRCLVAVCGDNLVWAGVEACDAGAGNADDGPCTTACARNVCGDGLRFAGVEACDDGNTASGDGCRADCGKVEACGDAVVDAGEACDDGNGNAVDGCDACAATAWSAAAIVGGTANASGAGFSGGAGYTFDLLGNLYIADNVRCQVRRIDAVTGVDTVVAGTNACGLSGDGGPATSARLNGPDGIAVDGLGNLYIADTGNTRIRRVAGTSGVITTLVDYAPIQVGSPAPAPAHRPGVAATPDARTHGGPAPVVTPPATRPGRAAELTGATATTWAAPPSHLAAAAPSPREVVVDGLGVVTFAMANAIGRFDPATGALTRIAGTGLAGFSGDGGPAVAAKMNRPTQLVLGPDGSVYVADTGNNRVRRIDATTGNISTVIGGGVLTPGGPLTGSNPTSVLLTTPQGVGFDALGRLCVAATSNVQVACIDPTTGKLVTIAGTGVSGNTGDGGAATSATFQEPANLQRSPSGELHVLDRTARRIRVIRTSGLIETRAGDGSAGFAGDGAAATSARLARPFGLLLDDDGQVIVAERDGHRVRTVDPETELIRTLAGDGSAGYLDSDDGASSARFQLPSGLARDAAGRVYVADAANQRIRRIDPVDGSVVTVAGSGLLGFAGDGGPAGLARLSSPQGVGIGPDGALYIADSTNNRIRRVDPDTDIITTVAGSSTLAMGDGGPATAAGLTSPRGLAFDAAGNMYIAESARHRIRRVDVDSGVITTVAGIANGGLGAYSGDGGLAIAAELDTPVGVAFGPDGLLYIADSGNGLIRRIDGDGVIRRVAGSPPLVGPLPVDCCKPGDGDGDAALGSWLATPTAVALDADGDLFIADSASGRVRRVDHATGVITSIAGSTMPEAMGPAEVGRFTDARGLALGDGLTFVAGGTTGTVQVLREGAGWIEVVAGRYPHQHATGALARYRELGFGTVGGVAWSPPNQLYLTERESHRVWAVRFDDVADEDSWTIVPYLNPSATEGYADGPLADARLRSPAGLTLADDVLYVADAGNHVIRAVAGDQVTTIAGTPQTLGYFGDGGAATDALLNQPQAVARCPSSGDLYIADTGNHRVRRIDAATGVITTVLGDGVGASSGEGAPSTAFPVDAPSGLACDAAGNVYVSSSDAVRLLPATIPLDASTGVVDGTGPVVTIYGGPPRTTFPAIATSCLTGLVLVDDALVRVADGCTGLMVDLWIEPAP